MSLAARTSLGPFDIGAPIRADGMSACGRRAERVRESKRGSWCGGGAPRHFFKPTNRAHSERHRWD